jgi:cytochrome c oxidase subunit 1
MGAVFGIFAGFTHWFPLFSGVTIHSRWTKIHFFLMFIGVNLTFFPQHFLGLAGIPRRYSDYPDAFTSWNVVSSIGSVLSFVGLVYFIFIVWEAFVSQRPVVSSSHMPTALEWQEILPLDFHNTPEPILLTTPLNERPKLRRLTVN